MLLRRDVLESMLQMYHPAAAGSEPKKAFQVKNMNIVDPLLATNNLGRSVTRANKARIRKALAAGAAGLSAILAKVGCSWIVLSHGAQRAACCQGCGQACWKVSRGRAAFYVTISVARQGAMLQTTV